MPELEELQRQIDEIRVMAEDALDKFPIRSTTTPGAGKERHIHDLGKHPGGVIAARVFNSGAIATVNNTNKVLTFDSERYDTDTIHSTSSNTGRLTTKTAGKYGIIGNAAWFGDPSDATIYIRLNGSTFIARSSIVGDYRVMNVSTDYNLAVDDYVELVVIQGSGGALNITANSNYSPEFMMARVGAAGTVGGGVPGTDHGALTGLGDDDHSLYLLAAGSRTGSTGSAQDFGSTGIKADVLAESTGGAGVTIDGVLLKDSGIAGAAVPATHSGSTHHAQAHAPESHTGTDITAAELEDLSDGGESALHSHAGGGGGDITTDAAWVAEGDLIKGTGASTAEIFSRGADHTVLTSTAAGLAWSAAPPLANIADTGDTNRVTLATSSPHVTLTGSTQMTVNAGVGVAPNSVISLSIATTSSHTIAISALGTQSGNSLRGLSIGTTMTSTGNSFKAPIYGTALIEVNNTTISIASALFFALALRPGTTGTHTITDVAIVFSRISFQDPLFSGENLNITHLSAGLKVDALTNAYSSGFGAVVITNTYGVYIKGLHTGGAGTTTQTNVYGFKVDTLSSGTNRYGLYIQDVSGGTINYAIWVDNGLVRLDGDGTHVWELPADATDPTSGGGAATGRIPASIGGGTVYIPYY